MVFIWRMARYTETVPVERPLEDVANACRRAFQLGRWKLINDHGWAFLVQEGMDLLAHFFRYRTQFAIFLRTPDGEGGPVSMEMTGKIFGFGPIPKRNLRKRMALLQGQIAHCLAAIIAEQEDEAASGATSMDDSVGAGTKPKS